MLKVLLPLQIAFIPALLLLLCWSVYLTLFKKDAAAGFALYLGLLIIVDGFLNTGLYIPGLPSGSVKFSEICALWLILSNRSRHPLGPGNKMVLFFSLYAGLVVVSCFTGAYLADGLVDLRRIVIPQIIAFWLGLKALRNENDFRKFFLYLGVLAIIIGLFTFWDLFFDRWLLKSGMLDKPEYYVTRNQGRYGSFFLNPNYLGGFSVLVFFGILASAMLEKVTWKRIILFSSLLALAFALIETQSRGPLLSFAAGLGFFLILPTRGYGASKAGLLAAGVIAFLILMPGFVERAVDRFDSVREETATNKVSRLAVWSYTAEIITDNPLLGIGSGERNFRDHMKSYGFVQAFGTESLDNPHNSYLQLAVSAGVPSLVVFLLLNWMLFRRGLRFLNTYGNDKKKVLLVSGFLAGLSAFLMSLVSDMFLFTQNVAPIYWGFFGLTLSILVTKDRSLAALPTQKPIVTRRA